MSGLSSRRVAGVATSVCLFLLALVPVTAVGAQAYPYPYPGTSPIAPSVTVPATTTVAPAPVPAIPVPAVPAVPAAPAAPVSSSSGYPPNALISSYFDPRYCGDGAVSVVTDAGGALINICTSTGQRILPIYPDYAPAPYAPGVPYGAPAYTAGYYGNGALSGYNYAYTPYAANTNYGYAAGYTGTRQYTDNNSNCPNGDVTQTPSGFFCTANGAPAARVR